MKLLGPILLAAFLTVQTEVPSQQPIEAPREVRIESVPDAALEGELRSSIESAVGMIRTFAPVTAEGHAFAWKGDPSKLQNKLVVLNLIQLKDLQDRPELSGPISNAFDGIFTQRENSQTGQMELWVDLIIDRIFFDPAGSRQPNSSARLTIALARQVLGPVQDFLEGKTSSPEPESQQNRGHCIAIRFMEIVLEQAKQNPSLESLAQDMRSLLPRERGALKNQTVQQACQNVFP